MSFLHNNPLPYRKGVGVMLFNRHHEVFVGKRIDTRSEAWQMPQGGIDADEPPIEAAYRELAEETSVTKVELLAESSDWYHYDLPETLIPKLWGGQYKGQQQKWFAMRYLGDDDAINIHTQHAEFLAWKWVRLSSLPSLIVDFKRDMYQQLVDEFSPILLSATDA